jgi:hypothetical protein
MDELPRYPSAEQKRADAEDFHEWYDAYVHAGFTRAEAAGFITAMLGRVVVQAGMAYPPELSQLIERQTKFFEDINDKEFPE